MFKYLYLLKLQFSLVTTYRFDLFWRWIFAIVQIIVPISLWGLTAQGDESDYKRIVIYFIIFHGFLGNAHTSAVSRRIGEAISTGALNNYLQKPLSFPLTESIKVISRIFARLTVPTIIFFIAFIPFREYLSPASIENFLIFTIFSIIGLVVWNLITNILGYISFWVIEIGGLTVVADLILTFLKGAYVPIFLFPELLQKILKITPIPYMIAFPIDVYQGRVGRSERIEAFVIMSIWGIVLFIIAKLIYKKGLKHYEAYVA